MTASFKSMRELFSDNILSSFPKNVVIAEDRPNALIYVHWYATCANAKLKSTSHDENRIAFSCSSCKEFNLVISRSDASQCFMVRHFKDHSSLCLQQSEEGKRTDARVYAMTIPDLAHIVGMRVAAPTRKKIISVLRKEKVFPRWFTPLRAATLARKTRYYMEEKSPPPLTHISAELLALIKPMVRGDIDRARNPFHAVRSLEL